MRPCSASLDFQRRLAMLTKREREVLTHVLRGKPNKQTAHDLGIVLKTVKVHRSRVMTKLGARNIVHLVRMAERVGL